MAKRSVEREVFLGDILATAVEGGINDWAAVTRWQWEDLGAENWVADIVDANAEDGDEPDFEPVTINTDTIAHGIAVIKSWKKDRDFQPNYFGDGGAYWREFLKADRTNGDDGDYDAIIADWIVQAGIFGEIVYG